MTTELTLPPQPKPPLWAYFALVPIAIILFLIPGMPARDIFGDGSR
jgi:hypothetical protein